MNLAAADLYATLQSAARRDAPIGRVCVGLGWTALESEAVGLCFSPPYSARTLPWSGSLIGRPRSKLVERLTSPECVESSLALAALNAAVNHEENDLLRRAEPLEHAAPPHLQVFAHYAPLLRGAKVVVVGRYPGLEIFWRDQPYTCVEKRPFEDTLPAEAAAYELPRADFVFLTASSIANHTLHTLLPACAKAHVVLMGPSAPWLAELRYWGVHAIAGVRVKDARALWDVVSQAGGTMLFERAVQYHHALL